MNESPSITSFYVFPLFSSRRFRSIGSGKSGANREGGVLWLDVGIRGRGGGF